MIGNEEQDNNKRRVVKVQTGNKTSLRNDE